VQQRSPLSLLPLQYSIQQTTHDKHPLSQLKYGEAFEEMSLLAEHARDHILRFGFSSDYYVKYFGNANTAEPAGWFDKIVNGDKTGVLFRCDDPDDNCRLAGKHSFLCTCPM